MWGVRAIFAAAAFILGTASLQGVSAAQQVCLSPGETRAAVAEAAVVAPRVAVSAARNAASGGEVVRAELCRQGGGYVYNISVLRRDGHVQRVAVDGRSGRVLGSR